MGMSPETASRPGPRRLDELEDRYAQLFQEPSIHDLRQRGGQVFIAVERRPVEEIQCLLALGHRHFAVKYAQQLHPWVHPPLAASFHDVVLHLYGQLQRNKVSQAVCQCDGVESLDRIDLAHRLRVVLDREPSCSRLKSLMLQINLGREPQKTGVPPAEAASLVQLARNLGLPIVGVMAIPPRNQDPVPHFRWLRRFADQQNLPQVHMGMSDDFTLAIREGATAIRIGRRLFGASS